MKEEEKSTPLHRPPPLYGLSRSTPGKWQFDTIGGCVASGSGRGVIASDWLALADYRHYYYLWRSQQVKVCGTYAFLPLVLNEFLICGDRVRKSNKYYSCPPIET